MLVCSDQTAARIDVEVKQIIASCYERAMQILSDNKDKLHELAKILLDKETITGIEFMAALAPRQLSSSFENKETDEVTEAGQEGEAGTEGTGTADETPAADQDSDVIVRGEEA